MTISILTTDTNLNILSWDSQLTEMTGLTKEQVFGRSFFEIIPDLETKGLRKTFDNVLNKGVIKVLEGEFNHCLISVPPQIESKYFERMQQKVTISPLWEQGNIMGTIVTIEDITAQLEEQMDIQEQLTPLSNSEFSRQDVCSTNSELPLLPSTEGLGGTSHSLFPLLQHEDWRVRQQAITILKQYSNPEITRELVQLMRQEHRNPNLLNAILQTFATSIIDPIPALIECLNDEDQDLRIYTVLALGERQDPRGIEPLMRMLKDPDINVRYHTIEALGRLKAGQAVDQLLEIVQSSDFYLGFAALDALLSIDNTTITSRLVPLIQNTMDWQVRRTTIDNLAISEDPQLIQDLVRLLKKHHRNPNILNSILQIFSISNQDCFPFLQECLKEPDPELRTYIALALGERQDLRAIPDLIKLLDDPEPNVRYYAIESLGYLQGIEAIDPLLEIVFSGDFFLAFPALSALTRIGKSEQGRRLAPTIASKLVPLLEEDSLQVQIIEVMEQLGDKEVVLPLARLFNHNSSLMEMVAKAINSIYQRYDVFVGEGKRIARLTAQGITSEGINHLLQALKSVNPQNLASLVFVLGCLNGREVELALSQLLEQSEVRNQVIHILVSYGPRVCDLLLTQLEAQDMETRKAAIIALGRIGSSQGVQALTNLLTTEHPELVMITTSALAKIGDHRAFESLLSLLGHPDSSVRLGAVASLNSLGHPEMAGRILELMDDPNEYVRESALKIAGYFAYSDCIERILKAATDPVERVRRTTIENIVYLEDERIIEVLIRALNEDTPSVRAAAARAMGEVDKLELILPLINALSDNQPWVRYHALCSISKFSLDDLKQKLAPEIYVSLKIRLQEITLSDIANQVRAAAIEALGYFAQEEAVDLLSQLSREDDEDIGRAALRALGKVNHPRAIAPLLAALNSPNPERRLDAIQVFREREGVDAQVTLQWMATADPDERLVQAAIESLARLATPSAIAFLLELSLDPQHRAICINSLVNRAGQTSKIKYIESIAHNLNHHQGTVRENIVEILKLLKHPYASEYLIAALNDQDDSVRLAAVKALVELGNPSCQEQLRLLARTDPLPIIRRAAQKGLYQ
jgi:PAS domain S-box-containing protein